MSLLVPGMKVPPFLIPYCARCEQPVERFTYLPVTSPYYLDLEAQCCGVTQGAHVSTDEVFRLKSSNAKLFLVTKPGGYHHVNDIRRAV